MTSLRPGAKLFPLPLTQLPDLARVGSRRLTGRRCASVVTGLGNGAVMALNRLFHSDMSNIPMYSNARNFPSPVISAVAHVQSCSQRFVRRLGPAPVAGQSAARSSVHEAPPFDPPR